VLLVGQPIGMLALLVAGWGPELRAGLGRATSRIAGQLVAGIVLALIVAGAGGVVVRVRTAGLEPFSVGPADVARQLTRVNDVAPALALTDQAGQEITLAAFRGRRVIVAFAYAHCETVCPLIVADVLAVRERVTEDPPAVLVVTLDPWRDTPSRLASIAKGWGITGEAHVLSGAPDVVERTLNAWRVPRARNEKTGEISHPSMAYVIGADGRIAYVVSGNAGAIAAAVRALQTGIRPAETSQGGQGHRAGV
jgi:cytochrome oxidase Cu insertion factor (SCO1/SenC/PrrC family)